MKFYSTWNNVTWHLLYFSANNWHPSSNDFANLFIDKPGPPGTPDIVGTHKSSVALKWAPPTEDGGSPVFNYALEYRSIGAFKWNQANETTTVSETPFSITALKEGGEYEFRVSAENKAGLGEPSAPTKPVKILAPVGMCLYKVLYDVVNLCYCCMRCSLSETLYLFIKTNSFWDMLNL